MAASARDKKLAHYLVHGEWGEQTDAPPPLVSLDWNDAVAQFVADTDKVKLRREIGHRYLRQTAMDPVLYREITLRSLVRTSEMYDRPLYPFLRYYLEQAAKRIELDLTGEYAQKGRSQKMLLDSFNVFIRSRQHTPYDQESVIKELAVEFLEEQDKGCVFIIG